VKKERKVKRREDRPLLGKKKKKKENTRRIKMRKGWACRLTPHAYIKERTQAIDNLISKKEGELKQAQLKKGKTAKPRYGENQRGRRNKKLSA